MRAEIPPQIHSDEGDSRLLSSIQREWLMVGVTKVRIPVSTPLRRFSPVIVLARTLKS
jgi:hypothetical protein